MHTPQILTDRGVCIFSKKLKRFLDATTGVFEPEENTISQGTGRADNWLYMGL